MTVRLHQFLTDLYLQRLSPFVDARPIRGLTTNVDSPSGKLDGWKGRPAALRRRKPQLRGTPSATSTKLFYGGNVSAFGRPRSKQRNLSLVNGGVQYMHCCVAEKTPLPADIDAAQFHCFFDDKVDGVRSTSEALSPSFSPNPSAALFNQFQSVTVNDVTAAVRALPDKTCALRRSCSKELQQSSSLRT